MACIYEELANKLEVHQKLDGSPGFHLSELDVQTIVAALRYTADWKSKPPQSSNSKQDAPMPQANLYRVLPWSNLWGGYVVYRYCFDEAKCSLEEGAAAHKQAVFVDEVSARDYCEYRNRLVDLNGDDALPPVRRSGKEIEDG